MRPTLESTVLGIQPGSIASVFVPTHVATTTNHERETTKKEDRIAAWTFLGGILGWTGGLLSIMSRVGNMYDFRRRNHEFDPSIVPLYPVIGVTFGALAGAFGSWVWFNKMSESGKYKLLGIELALLEANIHLLKATGTSGDSYFIAMQTLASEQVCKHLRSMYALHSVLKGDLGLSIKGFVFRSLDDVKEIFSGSSSAKKYCKPISISGI
jgi:hypothetical protein